MANLMLWVFSVSNVDFAADFFDFGSQLCQHLRYFVVRCFLPILGTRIDFYFDEKCELQAWILFIRKSDSESIILNRKH